MSLKIQANEELFNKWKQICAKLNSGCAIVQNDMESSKKEINEWWQITENNIKELVTVRKEVIDYIKKINT